jgi:hypothetical protein
MAASFVTIVSRERRAELDGIEDVAQAMPRDQRAVEAADHFEHRLARPQEDRAARPTIEFRRPTCFAVMATPSTNSTMIVSRMFRRSVVPLP